jgi:hypothetical protein
MNWTQQPGTEKWSTFRRIDVKPHRYSTKSVGLRHAAQVVLLLGWLLFGGYAPVEGQQQDWIKWEDDMRYPAKVFSLVVEGQDSIRPEIVTFSKLERLFVPHGPRYISDAIGSLQHLKEIICIDHGMKQFPLGLLRCTQLTLLHMVSGPLDINPGHIERVVLGAIEPTLRTSGLENKTWLGKRSKLPQSKSKLNHEIF